MTKKDYKLIIRVINETFESPWGDDEFLEGIKIKLIKEFVRELQVDNPNFNEEKFWAAAKIFA